MVQMINYVGPKFYNFNRVQELLKQSENINIFTNNGPVKQQLEQQLQRIFQINNNKKIVCLSSGTSALYVLLSLFEKKLNRKLNWLTHSFTFPCANVMRLNTDVVDIDIDTCSILIKNLEQYDGIIIPTLFGTIPNLEILDFCIKNKKIIIFDNASSPLSKNNGININNLGNAAIGSNHQTKFMGVGELGFAVVDVEDYDLVNSLANFGFSDDRRYNNLGSNSKASDFSAAFVLSHIESYDIAKHINVQNKYIEAIKNIKNVQILSPKILNQNNEIVYGNIPLLFKDPINHLVFVDVGIQANKYYKPLKNLPNANFLYERIVNLPLYSTLTDYDLSLIFKKIEVEAAKQ